MSWAVPYLPLLTIMVVVAAAGALSVFNRHERKR